MDHQDLQVVANIYQMNVHILTTGVRGNEAPSARWTHLVPDERLKQFSTMQMPDMWLFHQDNIHYDLIIPKNSILATQGCIKPILLLK